MSFLRKLVLISYVVLVTTHTAFAAKTSTLLLLPYVATQAGLAFKLDTLTLEALFAIPHVKTLSVRERAAYYANLFLNNKTPYVADPLGEGPEGKIAKGPLYRLDGFDCTTFVETVMALSLSRNADEFKIRINQIRYKNGAISYETRNHFTSVDWIPNNVANGFVKDITEDVAGSLMKVSQTSIDKENWFLKKAETAGAVAESEIYRAIGDGISKTIARINYVSKEDLLNKPEILNRIPSGSIFSLVRPNWDLVAAIGNRLDVSHQGYLIREDGILYMVHASNGMGRDGSDNYMGVKKEALTSYISRVMLSKASMAGFNILALPKNILN